MHVHWFQHVPFEGLGTIAAWLRQHGHRITCSRLYAGESVAPAGDCDWLIVMGGPMGVDDEKSCPWLKPEKAAIADALDAEKRVLGICLGAQLMASVMGADVTRNGYREIGWWPVSPTASTTSTPVKCFAETMDVFHWHGDTFGVPPGCEILCRSAACENQAFAAGPRVLGLQFHLEVTPASVEGLITHCADELIEEPYVQSRAELQAESAPYARTHAVMADVLSQMAAD